MGSFGDVMVNVLNYDIVVSEFKLHTPYYAYFQIDTLVKGMELSSRLWLKQYPYFLYKDDFGIKLPTKIDMPLKKETKPVFVNILVE